MMIEISKTQIQWLAIVLVAGLAIGCNADSSPTGQEVPSVESIVQQIDAMPMENVTEDGQQTISPSQADKVTKQKEKRKENLQKQIEESEMCKMSCEDILERYREAVELAISISDNSKLDYFSKNANDPCLITCKSNAAFKEAFKQLKEKLNPRKNEEETFK